MRIDHTELEQWARDERSRFMAELLVDAIAGAVQWVRKAWRSSSSCGTNSSAPMGE